MKNKQCPTRLIHLSEQSLDLASVTKSLRTTVRNSLKRPLIHWWSDYYRKCRCATHGFLVKEWKGFGTVQSCTKIKSPYSSKISLLQIWWMAKNRGQRIKSIPRKVSFWIMRLVITISLIAYPKISLNPILSFPLQSNLNGGNHVFGKIISPKEFSILDGLPD